MLLHGYARRANASSGAVSERKVQRFLSLLGKHSRCSEETRRRETVDYS